MSRYRRPIVLVGEPPSFIETDDPEEASLAAEAFATQWAYVHYQADASDLFPYQGQQVAGRPIETDSDALDEWARRGEFDLAEVYREMFR